MKHYTLKQIGKIIFWSVFAPVLLCSSHPRAKTVRSYTTILVHL